MCSDGLKAKQAASAHENEEKLKDEERQRLAEFEAHIRRGMEQFEAGLAQKPLAVVFMPGRTSAREDEKTWRTGLGNIMKKRIHSLRGSRKRFSRPCLNDRKEN